MATEYVVPPPSQPAVNVRGIKAMFPVRRIFCILGNYTSSPWPTPVKDGVPPVFTKPADAIVPDGATLPYTGATRSLYHEVQLVAAIGRPARAVDAERARSCIFGFAVGVDLGRRDLIDLAKRERLPWDPGSAFDLSAPVGAIQRATDFDPSSGRIRLDVNGDNRQDADIADMVQARTRRSGLHRLTGGRRRAVAWRHGASVNPRAGATQFPSGVIRRSALASWFLVSIFAGTRPHTPLFLSAAPTTTHAPRSPNVLAALQKENRKKVSRYTPGALKQTRVHKDA
jgi:fumarylpyruvate hydrolase